jgi:hypothetical protein
MCVGAFACSLRGVSHVASPDSVCRSYRTGNVAGHTGFHSNARTPTDYAGRNPGRSRFVLEGQVREYSAPGVLIPWHSIQHIEYYATTQASTASTNLLRIKSARLYLAPGHLVPIDEVSILRKMSLPFGIDASRNTGIDWDNTVFLNAVTDFGKPETYVRELDDLRKQYTNSAFAS